MCAFPAKIEGPGTADNDFPAKFFKSSADCWLFSRVPNLTVGLVEDLENLHEQVDDVQVELDGGQDVFLLTDTAHDHLGVVHNEKAEQNGAKNGHASLGNFPANKEMNKRGANKDHEAGIQSRPKAGEVTLGLKGEGCKSSHNSWCQNEGLQHHKLVEESDHDADSVGHDDSECGKEDEVNRMLLPLDVQGHQEAKGQEKCGHQHPGVQLNKNNNKHSKNN